MGGGVRLKGGTSGYPFPPNRSSTRQFRHLGFPHYHVCGVAEVRMREINDFWLTPWLANRKGGVVLVADAIGGALEGLIHGSFLVELMKSIDLSGLEVVFGVGGTVYKLSEVYLEVLEILEVYLEAKIVVHTSIIIVNLNHVLYAMVKQWFLLLNYLVAGLFTNLFWVTEQL